MSKLNKQYKILPYILYRVIGSAGAYIVYNGVTYNVNDTFVGVSGFTDYTEFIGAPGYVEEGYVEAGYTEIGSGYAGVVAEESTIFLGLSLEFELHKDEILDNTNYQEITKFDSISLEMALQPDEFVYSEKTVLKGISLEFAYDNTIIIIS